MATAAISSKFQAVIPKEVREKLALKSGRKMAARGALIADEYRRF